MQFKVSCSTVNTKKRKHIVKHYYVMYDTSVRYIYRYYLKIHEPKNM